MKKNNDHRDRRARLASSGNEHSKVLTGEPAAFQAVDLQINRVSTFTNKIK